MHNYIFFYDYKNIEIRADSLYEAKQKALTYFMPPKNKEHMVHGMLSEIDNTPVTHTPSF